MLNSHLRIENGLAEDQANSLGELPEFPAAGTNPLNALGGFYFIAVRSHVHYAIFGILSKRTVRRLIDIFHLHHCAWSVDEVTAWARKAWAMVLKRLC